VRRGGGETPGHGSGGAAAECGVGGGEERAKRGEDGGNGVGREGKGEGAFIGLGGRVGRLLIVDGMARRRGAQGRRRAMERGAATGRCAARAGLEVLMATAMTRRRGSGTGLGARQRLRATATGQPRGGAQAARGRATRFDG
jgi:hypothetical protein